MLEYSGILLLVKLEKMNVTPLKYLYPVSSSFPPSTAHSVNVSAAEPPQPAVHQDGHGVLLHLPGALPPVQPGVLVERGELEAGHLGRPHHAGQIQHRL